MWMCIDKRITDTDENIFLGIVYVPPSQSRFYNDDELSKLENEIMSMCSSNKYVIISGDINARTGKLTDHVKLDNYFSDLFYFDEDMANLLDKTDILDNLGIPLTRSSMDKKTNTTGYWLIDQCKNNNLFIVNGRVGKDKGFGNTTFRDKSTIDYTLCTAECFRLFDTFEVIKLDPLFFDGHRLLSWSLNVKMENCNITNINYKNTPARCKWLEKNKAKFIDCIDMSEILLVHRKLDDLTPSNENMDSITNDISRIFNKASSTAFQSSRQHFNRRPFDKPWFGPASKIARKKYHRARNMYNKNKNNKSRNNLNFYSKQYKLTMNKFIQKYKMEKIDKLRSMQNRNPKDYRNYIKSIDKKKDKQYPPLNSLYEHFKNINKSNEPRENYVTRDVDDNEILNKRISSDEICKCIGKLKNGKCPGDDNILNEYIKSTKHIFLPNYEKLFNVVFDTGIINSAWVEGTIRPIYKNKGDIKSVENYRPITILSCLGKLFTAILNNRLTDFLDKNEQLHENQAGFRQGYATTDHIFVLNSLIDIMKASKKKLYCAFIDFSQAFDSIWRGGLWRKLIFNSINGKFFRIVHSMYENIKSCVRINDETSAYFPSECGVRQGENLSPLLFSLYMYLNDLENFIISGDVDSIDLEVASDEFHIYLKLLILLYADDTIIFSNDKDNFQKALDNFHEYCSMWKLNVNLTKTKVVVFNSLTNKNLSFHLGGQPTEISKSYKYLGVIFSKSGNFLQARKHIVDQAKKAMNLLFIGSNNLDLPIDLQIKLFDNTVLPILMYGCEVFGYENTDILEAVHLDFFAKNCEAKKKYTAIHDLCRVW